MKFFLPLVFLIIIFSCSESESYPWLNTLDSETKYEESGKRLMSLDFGLNPLESFNKNEKIIFIGVHGSRSLGYEWIYPLQTLDTERTATFFYRWDDKSCYLNSAEKLFFHLSKTIKDYPDLKKIILIGHSYGGVLVTSMVEAWNQDILLEIHSIAGPIGSSFSREGCNYDPPQDISSRVVFYQWRTQHHLDTAFSRLKEDPQTLNLEGSKITRLPATYRGRRLGHNWSISWVADELRSQKEPKAKIAN